MGLVYAEIKLSNPRVPGAEAVVVDALADSGALHLCIPQHLADELSLDKLYEREVTLSILLY